MIQLNPDDFNSFLNGMGQNVQWRRAFACPCVNPKSGQAKVNCIACSGKGRIWPGDPVAGVTGVAGGQAHKQWMAYDIADMSDVILSVPSDSPLYAIGPFDRVMFVNRTEPFSLNIVKGVNEKIRFYVTELEKVLYLLPDGSAADAEPPQVLGDGSLDWDAVEVPDGATFSVTGRRRTEYFCMPDTPFDRPHHAGATLPRRVVLRRFDQYLQQT